MPLFSLVAIDDYVYSVLLLFSCECKQIKEEKGKWAEKRSHIFAKTQGIYFFIPLIHERTK